MRFISVASTLAIGLVVLIICSENHQHISGHPFSQICNFVSDRIFLVDEIVAPWKESCLQSSEKYSELSLAEQRHYLRNLLESLNVSHLDLYEPQEVKSMWSETKRTTGIISEFVDGQLVVIGLLPNSTAQKNGVKLGDQIVSINNEAPNPQAAQVIGGDYELNQLGEVKKIKLIPEELVVDEGLKVIRQTEKTAQLKIPTFRSDYFSEEQLKNVSKKLSGYKKIILDLRKNQGGNFVSGLRLLSMFLCGKQSVGYLLRPKFPNDLKSTMNDDMNDENQLELMNKSYYVDLQTFENYPCLTQSLAVLVDHETSSTAEMVAQALKDYRAAKIMGRLSAGKLLVGVWYPVEGLGQGVKISIPEAVYQTKRGRQIESNGVHVDETLDYSRADFERSEDTWLKVILNKF